MADAVIERLEHCRSLDEFYQICSPLQLYASRRFLQLEVDIVNRCNIRCVMCYHSLDAVRRRPPVYLTPDTFATSAARVLPQAHRLSLSLGNEPLMSPHFSSMLRVAAQHEVPHVNFFSNGLLLTDDHIQAILDFGVTQVCISIDGATRGTYNAIRRDGDFDRLISNVSRLVARRNAAGRRVPQVRFDVTMMQRNVHELVATVELAGRLGIDALSFRHLVAFEGLGMDDESLTDLKALSNYSLDRALARARDLGLVVEQHPRAFELEPGAGGRPTAADPYATSPYCPYPFFHITLAPDGQVLPCPHGHGERAYGTVSEETPLDQVWLNASFTRLRQRILHRDPPDMCRRCPWLGDRHPDINGLFASRHH